MGFFKRLFRRKKGGTAFGNFLRNIGNHYTGGLYEKWIFPKPTCGTTVQKMMDGSYRLPPIGCRIGSAYTPTPEEQATMSLNPETASFWNDVISSGNIGDMLQDVSDGIINGQWDFDSMSETTIDIIDDALGETVPQEIADINGITTTGELLNEQTFDSANQSSAPWNVEISVGGGGSSTSQTLEKATSWIKENVILFSSIVLAVVGAVYYFFFRKKSKIK